MKSVIYQLLLAVDFCHSNRIIHRDLKPQNILIDKEKETVKLADFGLARTFYIPIKEYTHEVITLWYRAPEILLGKDKYSTSVDIWSLGCIFYEIAHKKILFCGDSEIDQIFKIFKLLGTPKEETWPGVSKLKDFKPTFPKWNKEELSTVNTNLSPEGLDLLEKTLRLDPAKRITCL